MSHVVFVQCLSGISKHFQIIFLTCRHCECGYCKSLITGQCLNGSMAWLLGVTGVPDAGTLSASKPITYQSAALTLHVGSARNLALGLTTFACSKR
eukprot:1603181-Amphidinium_carterae.1